MVIDKPTMDAGWNFDNTYNHLPEFFFSRLEPTPVRSPQMVIFNNPLAAELGLSGQVLESQEGVAVFAGNLIPVGADPLAQAYAGHQFGYFTMLGDGRALLLGEQITPEGKRFDIQLKGSGRTPYSRQGDGRAALGPMLREYVISEALHGLGIPTTRSLAVVSTGERVYRETALPGAVLTRVAASHLRVGTFQYAAIGGTPADVRLLADYTIQRHYPPIVASENKYLALLQEVIQVQARLVAAWQLVGFVHGVMNTDNMAISGQTIDYGPCAFLDGYDEKTVFSSIDLQGRYAFVQQPTIAQWNLARFAETLLPLIHPHQDQAVEMAQEILGFFAALYQECWFSGMKAKLGLFTEEAADAALIDQLLTLMQQYGADYTNTFRALTVNISVEQVLAADPEYVNWFKKWQDRLRRQPNGKPEGQQLMYRSNPAIIPRNHQVEAVLEAAVGESDYTELNKLLAVLTDPYAYSSQQEEYAALPAASGSPYQTFCGT